MSLNADATSLEWYATITLTLPTSSTNFSSRNRRSPISADQDPQSSDSVGQAIFTGSIQRICCGANNTFSVFADMECKRVDFVAESEEDLQVR